MKAAFSDGSREESVRDDVVCYGTVCVYVCVCVCVCVIVKLGVVLKEKIYKDEDGRKGVVYEQTSFQEQASSLLR